MKIKSLKTLILSSLVVFSVSEAHATRVLTNTQASKLTFDALTASPSQWKRWSHKTTFTKRKTPRYKIRLASYKFHSVKQKRNHHHHYRT